MRLIELVSGLIEVRFGINARSVVFNLKQSENFILPNFSFVYHIGFL